MAEILELRGITEVSQQGTLLRRQQPTRGGDTFTVLQWWDKSAHAEYVPCVKVHVERTVGDVDLCIPASKDLELTIEYDGDDGLSFYHHRAISRIGIQLRGDYEIVGEYIFPKFDGHPVHYKIEELPVQGLKQYYGYRKDTMEDFGQQFITMDAGDLTSPLDDICDLNADTDSFDLNVIHQNG